MSAPGHVYTSDDVIGLLLAVTDMQQAIEAARLLEIEAQRSDPDERHHQRLRALETAIAVCYVRPLKGKPSESYRVPEHDVRPTLAEHELWHDELIRVRNKAYAHTDKKESKREAIVMAEGGLESWEPWIEARDVPDVIALAEHQRDRFRAIALANSK